MSAEAPPNGNVIRAGNASAFGGAVAVVIVLTAHMNGRDFPAGYEAALAVIISTCFVYARAILEKITGVSLP
jgi:hypothetical protein